MQPARWDVSRRSAARRGETGFGKGRRLPLPAPPPFRGLSGHHIRFLPHHLTATSIHPSGATPSRATPDGRSMFHAGSPQPPGTMRHDVGGATLVSQESLSERGHGEPRAGAVSVAREISRVPGAERSTSGAVRVGRCHSSASANARRKNASAVRRRASDACGRGPRNGRPAGPPRRSGSEWWATETAVRHSPGRAARSALPVVREAAMPCRSA